MPTIFQDALWHFMLTEALRGMHKMSLILEKNGERKRWRTNIAESLLHSRYRARGWP